MRAASTAASQVAYMAADSMPQMTPVIVTHCSPDVIPEIDAAIDPKNAATHIQNLRLVSLLFISCPPSMLQSDLYSEDDHDAQADPSDIYQSQDRQYVHHGAHAFASRSSMR